MSKILITGVAGFLGSHLADALIKEGHEVYGIDNLSGGDLKNVPAFLEDFMTGDAGNLVNMTIMCEGMDIVYHCACMPHEGVSMYSPKFVGDSVFSVSMAVASAAIENRVKRLVYLSSMARYGTQIRTPFTEKMWPQPQDPYGIAKFASEQAIKVLCEAHGMEHVIAVPHSIIGPRQKYDDPFRNVAAIFINLMLQGRSPAIYGDGLQTRSFSYIDDVVEPLIRMGTQDGIDGEVFNIGPDGNDMTILELYAMCARLTGFEGKVISLPGRPGEVKHASCSADKARHVLGYKPVTSTEEGLRKMVEYIKKNGPKPFVYHLPLEIHRDTMPKTWSERLY